MRTYILDENRNVKPVDLMVWSEWFGSNDRRVRLDEVGGCVVSTVFVGLERDIFETMVFDHPGEDVYQDRYNTWDEAVKGHEKAMAWVEETLLTAIPEALSFTEGLG